MLREFASRVKSNGPTALVDTHEEAIAMHLVLSGMFDAEIDRIKKMTAVLSKHEYAINTVTQINAMKAEAEAFSEQAVADTTTAAATLKEAKAKAKVIIDTATKSAQAAVDARATTIAEAEKAAVAVMSHADDHAKGLVAAGHVEHAEVTQKILEAQNELANHHAAIEDARQTLAGINKTVAGEKARILKMFDK
jgi:hypothetical protein